MNTNPVNINTVVDEAKFTPFHWSVLIWCLLIIIFDGYDLVIYGVALPLLMQEWGLSAVQAGLLASTALFGMMFGAMSFGTLSDKLGRKKTIMICVAIFSGFTFLGAFASNPIEFGILRFLAGLGIGGVMPNVVALMTEYAPKRIRSTLVAVMFSGYAIGGMTSALLGAWLVTDYGWKIMFYIAIIPFLALPILWKFLPESLMFLTKKGETEKVREIVQKIAPEQAIQPETTFKLNEPVAGDDAPLKALFQQGRTFSTMMFWVAFFMCLLMVYALGSWLPKLMIQAGYSLGASMIFLFALNIGGMVGAIGGGALADRFHLKTSFDNHVHRGCYCADSTRFQQSTNGAVRFNCNCGRGNHWLTNSTVYLCCTVLSNCGALYRYGLGFRHRTHWRNCWTSTDRWIVNF